MDKTNLYWQVYVNLEKEVIELSKLVYFADTTNKVNSKTGECKASANHHLDVYSPYIADLLVRCCIEIEAISKEMYFSNGGSKARGDHNLYFDTDCLKLLNDNWGMENKVVVISSSNFNFTKTENLELLPLKGAGKRSTAYWAKAYQAVKHDRYYSLYKGNIKALLQAMAALYLLNIYHRDIKLSAKYLEYKKLDMSLGSNIFSLKFPSERYIIDTINGNGSSDILRADDTPYILKYTQDTYKRVVETNAKANQERIDYLLKQPEMNDLEFIKYWKSMQSSGSGVNIFYELHKYRLNKRLPADMTFEERRERFIQSSEWSGEIRQNNNPLKEHELTEENLQSVIDRAAAQASIEQSKKIEAKRFIAGLNEAYCELVVDKNNIKYYD